MKKIYCLILLMSCFFADKINLKAQVILFPYVHNNFSESIIVESVNCGTEVTSLNCSVGNVTTTNVFEWITIDAESYIIADAHKYQLTKTEGIGISPERTFYSKVGEIKNITLYFAPLTTKCKTIDFIENEESNWKLFGIDLVSNADVQDSCIAIINTVYAYANNGEAVYGRQYLERLKGVFDRNGNEYIYVLVWGELTSCIWNQDSSDENTEEYLEYLQFVFNGKTNTKDFFPDEVFLKIYWLLAHDYAFILKEKQEYDKALITLENIHRWLSSYPQLWNTEQYAMDLYNYWYILGNYSHNYDLTLDIAKEYLCVVENVHGLSSSKYGIANAYLALSYKALQKLDFAEKYMKKAIDIYEKSDNCIDSELQYMKSVLSSIIAIRTGVADTKGIDILSGKLSIEDCLQLLVSGQGEKAIPSLIKYKEDKLNGLPFDTLGYVHIVGVLVSAYTQIGDFPTAQKELDAVFSGINIKNIPAEWQSSLYGAAGMVYYGLKDYSKALSYFRFAGEYYEVNGIYDLEYIKFLQNYAMTYYELGDLLNAKWHIDESISVYETNIGSIEKPTDLGFRMLNNKAMIYLALDCVDVAEETLTKIVGNFSQTYINTPSLTLAMNNLAAIYLKKNRYKECISLLENTQSPDREIQAIILQNIACAYIGSNNPNTYKAIKNFNDFCLENCFNVFNYFSEADREKYWDFYARVLIALNNFAAYKFNDCTEEAYDIALFTKNLYLLSGDVVKHFALKSNDSNIKSLYSRINYLRNNIIYNTNNDSITIWNNELREAERLLMSSIPDINSLFRKSSNSWKDIQNAISSDELAIEFIFTNQTSNPEGNIWTDDIDRYYSALVIQKNDTLPRLITLCEDSDLESRVNGRFDAADISKIYENKDGDSVYNLVWSKLEPYLKGKRTIYFSPTGIINNINHSALLLPKEDRLGDKYNLVRVSSTSQILEQKTVSRYNTAALYGGINYDEPVEDMKHFASHYTPSSSSSEYLAFRSEDDRGKWNYLEGSKSEVNNIYQILSNKNIKTTSFEWNEANEESLKSLSGNSPDIMHLSTHGFFIDSYEKFATNPFMMSLGSYSDKEDNLTRTGLLMAGANNVWTGKTQISGIEDGILTADEISRQDLSNTKLVVLSACETAKGHIDFIDGVMGLQKGLKRAGVGSIIMSLWNVPDIATSILMTSFYDYLVNGDTPRIALQKAQKDLRKKEPAYDSPYYWAAWILLDGLN